MDYWKECISEAFEDAGIAATDKQIETVTEWGAEYENGDGNYSGIAVWVDRKSIRNAPKPL